MIKTNLYIVFFMTEKWSVLHSDCLTAMQSMEDNSIDFCVTDPPYGLKFMGKKWDYNVPDVNCWKELLRILKPGAMIAVFGGSRTYHRMVLNVEDAGFEIRDCIMWIYGQGFPKSMDVSKAIDKSKGHQRDLIDRIRSDGKSTGCAATGFVNGCEDATKCYSNEAMHPLAKEFSGYGTALKPAVEPICLAMKPLDGTFAQNAEKWGVAGINIEESRIGNPEDKRSAGTRSYKAGTLAGGINGEGELQMAPHDGKGRWPANIIFDEEAAQELDKQSGISKSPSGNITGSYKLFPDREKYQQGKRVSNSAHGDSGGASPFFYCAKASPSERNGSSHPTMKPLSLMKYIIKLLAPPVNPILIDPFAGSGSTIVAAKELGIRGIGIEREEEYCEIAKRRLDNTCPVPEQYELDLI